MGDISSFGILSHALTRDSSRGEVLRLSRDLLEIVESRYKRNSTIFCSHFDIPGWRSKLSDPLLADAICDRIVHGAYTVVIGGKESMRKRKGLQDA